MLEVEPGDVIFLKTGAEVTVKRAPTIESKRALIIDQDVIPNFLIIGTQTTSRVNNKDVVTPHNITRHDTFLITKIIKK